MADRLPWVVGRGRVSHPPVIWPPGLDRLFDVGAGQFLIQRALGQLRVVANEV